MMKENDEKKYQMPLTRERNENKIAKQQCEILKKEKRKIHFGLQLQLKEREKNY